MKSNWLGIRGKLFILVGVSVFAFIGTVVYSSYTLRHVAAEIDFLGDERIPLAEDIADLRTYAHAIPRYAWLAYGNEPKSEGRIKALETLDEYQKKYDENLEKYSKYSSISDKSKEMLVELTSINKEIDPVLDKIDTLLKNGTKEDDETARKTMLGEMAPLVTKMRDLSKGMGTLGKERNQKYVEEAVAAGNLAQRSLWILSSVICTFLLGFGYFFARSLVSSLSNITEAVGSASEQVSTASSQISQGAEKLSSAAQQQASSLEETSASLTEIAGMAESNVKGAEEADNSVKEVYGITEMTRKSMDELTTAMNSILESNERIVKLVKIIEEIGEKTEIIDDIVFKTQLLSFNASVEAERAGEHGRGFAVVAQEVGNLAQMSGKAATEISSIVKNSIKEAESVATENKTRVESGGKLAVSTRDKMESVLAKLSDVIDSVSKITAASREQSQGVGQITNAIDALNQSTQDTAGTAEESASASAELSGQAQSLMGLVGELRSIVTGSSQKIEKAEKVGKKAAKHSKNNNKAQTFSKKHEKVEDHAKNPHEEIKQHAEVVPIRSAAKEVVVPSEFDAPVNSFAKASGEDGWDKL